MSVFRSLYDFASSGLPKCKLRESARRACLIFSGIASLRTFAGVGWSSLVPSADTAPEGFGVAKNELLGA